MIIHQEQFSIQVVVLLVSCGCLYLPQHLAASQEVQWKNQNNGMALCLNIFVMILKASVDTFHIILIDILYYHIMLPIINVTPYQIPR